LEDFSSLRNLTPLREGLIFLASVAAWVALAFSWQLFRAPFRQRDEFAQRVDELCRKWHDDKLGVSRHLEAAKLLRFEFGTDNPTNDHAENLERHHEALVTWVGAVYRDLLDRNKEWASTFGDAASLKVGEIKTLRLRMAFEHRIQALEVILGSYTPPMRLG